MYLARRIIKGKRRYFIAESYRHNENDHYLHRDLFDLGFYPADYVSYYSRYCYHVDPIIEDRLNQLNVSYSGDELEALFWPFIEPEIRWNLESLSCRKSRYQPRHLSEEEKIQLTKETHLFDKRRIYYLRYGNLDQSRIGRIPVKMFKVLLHKSRDEIEQYFLDTERVLRPAELKRYVFVIFNLQHFFTEHNACLMPYILDQDKLDERFLEEICALNNNTHFWLGAEEQNVLHEYLIRYLIMFFDYDFAGFSPWDDYIRDFMGRHREFRFPDGEKPATLKEASTVFGVSEKTLQTIDKSELTRLYRKKAHTLHPDKGGEHEAFVELTKIYKELLQSRK